MESKKFRKKIDALIKARKSLQESNVSEQVIENLNIAINELEDAYIAEVNFENQNS